MTVHDPIGGELAAFLSACPPCRHWADQDEGPYRVDVPLERRDIREDRDGVALQLGIRLAAGRRPAAVPGATVEVWHCDALGAYSGFPPPDADGVSAEYRPGATFLRGRQHCDANGMVEFRTIYPGWYPGRTVHIHVMVHLDRRALTTQLYFPEKVNDRVLAEPPYSIRPGRDTTNAADTVFPTGGEPAVVAVAPVGAGYRAGVCLVLAT